jgi:(4-(4-[2-(gamma-L-glutamylamino)ethyl]phenoxymethyl)furan-2-yl)methanamine synthase
MGSSMQAAERELFGWDVGGAHLKACHLLGERVVDVAQWPCPLWQGLHHLEDALAQAQQRWPALRQAQHAVTMSGEMVDLFAHREEGVQRIAMLMTAQLSARADALHFFAGDHGWCGSARAAAQWRHLASANWLATAQHAAEALRKSVPLAVLVDIGSTTSDFIALRQGEVLCHARTDVQRLATSELVYHGVVRTPLCALGPHITWRGQQVNVMNEFFATTADVYRLLGQLPAEHDQQPSADHAAKDMAATQQRLARMIGLDARDGTAQDWCDFAQAWRQQQLLVLRGQLAQVMQLHGLPDDVPLVSAGCGDFLVAGLMPGRCLAYADAVARIDASAPVGTRAWVQVCAPSVAVASLLHTKIRRELN